MIAGPVDTRFAPMSFDWVGEGTTARGVRERRFDVYRGSRFVPGVLWTPEDADGTPPLVLLGHGASGHKREEYILGLARRLVRRQGFAVAAIDGPVQGDRRADGGVDRTENFTNLTNIWRDDPTVTDEMVADWRSTLDALQDPAVLGPGPVGYWGLSMGTIFGLPFVAAEPRISAAVLGLMGLTGPSEERIRSDAAAITCPVLFLVQWNDELFDRALAFDLFDALATTDKRLHANPGSHVQVPVDEFLATATFLDRRLRPPEGS